MCKRRRPETLARMLIRHSLRGRLLWGVLALVTLGAGVPAPAAAQVARPARPQGWSDATHGSQTAPDYARLFAMDRVHELHITIPADKFVEMQNDLSSITPPMPGGRGFGRPGGPGGGFQQMAALMENASKACEGKAADSACTVDGQDGQCLSMFGGAPPMCVPAAMAAGLRRGGAIQLTTRDPMYVPVTVTFDGTSWTNVGMRYKGNSSLMSATASGNGKVPFRLDFDKYEHDHPEIANQRFYGFGKLTFSSNFTDDSQLREVLASEALRDRGVPAPRAAFYKVYVDSGKGEEYWGLYAMVEDPADGAMLDAQFGGHNGNLYKPDGPGADWTTFSKEGFPKKTNEKADDYRDVERAITALHAPRTDAAAWRGNLERLFDVDHFLRWLAVNTVIENWDAYGAMAHNYYLYADPAKKNQLRWIPWDNNMAFGVGPGGPGGRGGRFGGRGFVPPPGAPGFPGGGDNILHTNAGRQWPLFGILLSDPVYAARYRELLGTSMNGFLASATLEKRARALHALIAPAVVGPGGENAEHTTISSADAFNTSVDSLMDSVRKRQAAIRQALQGAQ